MTWRSVLKKVGPWAVAGLAAVAAVMLKDLSGLLADIQTAGSRSYGADVFTGPHWKFWDSAELRDAIELWGRQKDLVHKLIGWHVFVDALFIPAFAAILWKVLRSVGVGERFAALISIAYAAVDGLETLATWRVIEPLLGHSSVAESWALQALQGLTALKTALLIVVAVVAIVALVAIKDELTASAASAAVALARRGEEQHPVIALGWLVVLTVAFAALVALPGGGPLDQLPDVIRAHFDRGTQPALWILSALGLLLFITAVAVAALMATSPRGWRARSETLSNLTVLLAAGGISVVFVVWAWVTEDDLRPGPAAPFWIVAVLWTAVVLARWARIPSQEPAVVEGPPRGSWPPGALSWAGGLAGVVAVAGAVGLVRAAFPPWVLDLAEPTLIPWGFAVAVGCVGAIFGGAVVQAVVAAAARGPRWLRYGSAIVVGVAVAGVAALMAFYPARARSWASTGAVAVGFAFWALVIGLLVWVSRTCPRWDVTRRLGFGARTPWFTLLLVLGLVGGMLNKDGGYHDARLTDGEYGARYWSLHHAFRTWKTAIVDTCAPDPGERVPMVFVAAPGGGIRAAYWTASALEELFQGKCLAAHVFAISGVSGGSVGAATWVTATAHRQPAKTAVTAMSEDTSLPGVLAGLFLRDMVQPLTGNGSPWEDRAALMERGWTEATAVFGPPGDEVAWSAAGDGSGLGFVPVLALNGSSVTDGCRALVTNTARLPASAGPDCQGVPSPGRPVKGPVAGSIDPFVGLHSRRNADCEADADISVTTGAFLSARFPIVSPSGSLVRCVDGEEVKTAVVDGGYYEGSGLLTLLQLWGGIDESVAHHNATLGRAGPLRRNRIEPWFLVVDNHYRATAKRPPPGAPVELLAPLDALGQNVLTQTMLEQTAIAETADDGRTPRFVFLAPTAKPGVEAPLGWVLSFVSRQNLDEQLRDHMEAPGPSLAKLLKRLP